MAVTIEGVFKDGKVELSEAPRVDGERRVLVTFLDSKPEDAPSREQLRQRAFERMRAGVSLGGGPYPSRNDLHDRKTS